MRRLRPLALGLAAVALATVASPPPAQAQTVGARQRLVLTDGRTLVGTVVEVRADAVVIDVRGVRSEVPRSQIARVEDPGRFARTDPNGTRLFVSPTARTMPREGLRLSTAYFFVPNVAYGVTGTLDVSATASIPVGGTGLVSATAKFAPVQREGVALAAGVQAGTVYGDGFSDGLGGTFYGVGTFGDATRAATVGVYGIYAGSFGTNADFEVANGAAVVVGGELQVSNGIKLMTENAFLVPFEGEDGTGGILSGGVRAFGERIAADVALPLFVFGGGESKFLPVPVPLISLSYTIR